MFRNSDQIGERAAADRRTEELAVHGVAGPQTAYSLAGRLHPACAIYAQDEREGMRHAPLEQAAGDLPVESGICGATPPPAGDCAKPSSDRAILSPMTARARFRFHGDVRRWQ